MKDKKTTLIAVILFLMFFFFETPRAFAADQLTILYTGNTWERINPVHH